MSQKAAVAQEGEPLDAVERLAGVDRVDDVAESVLALAASLMLFIAVYQFFDNSQATAIGALRGYKDTRIPMIITLVGYWMVGLPLGCTLGFGWIFEPMGIYGFWIGLMAGLMTVAVSVCFRLWWLSAQHDVIRELSRV